MITATLQSNPSSMPPASKGQCVRFMDSFNGEFSSNVDQVFTQTKESNEHQDASLLLSVANIVLKEIGSEDIDWGDDSPPNPPPLSLVETENMYRSRTGNSGDADTRSESYSLTNSSLDLSRIRSVSIDVSDEGSSGKSSPVFDYSSKSNAFLISPENSPVSRRNPKRKSNVKALMLNKHCDIPTKKSVQAKRNLSGPVKTILRKKFSWKNYPELEAFLIANREEYLRHSALNYTVQQKQYNNTLTERLLELAADHGYVFDEEAFNFVTVRDRIRCYFKSYVQSAKKRGLIIGYAARKAGLLTDDDLERSASKCGRIVMPSSCA
mmetsp:Transcript_14533/g.21436  ORF Transcript_14533/g.21436 Transcript_14533/m.21436 type:complete len:324 (+) Transcript_14533:191-1162(+)|eukprot:CAMPEP_0194216040 /NCGR_PEP_ID=MMETSP0156-20130528/18227_1 /TAXON_ID=33649 /ORGANISM="Thalassionema nitzschioides, Strain L26-B" /LENGTH=323 /DNA_ID=CAMNT_0038944711 /DNA_START=124 /DNA_END=1095 /DNA_ORIENTATION=-